MIAQQEIDRLKQTVKIVDVLYNEGHKPAFVTGQECVYYSPFRMEKTPSFSVNTKLNAFKDFGSDETRGDVIRLVMTLKGLGFCRAVEFLKNWDGIAYDDSLSFSGKKPSDATLEEPGTVIQSAGTLHHPALMGYLKHRCISPLIASKYLKEVHYRRNGKAFFGVGMENDLGGWAIRNKFDYPQATRPAHYTTVAVPGSTSVSVFEGFFDFLSYLEYERLREPPRTTIILNSLSMLGRAMETLKAAKTVYCYLDNDKAGMDAIARLRGVGIPVVDCSEVYEGHKDFNEYYTLVGYWETFKT